MQFSSFRTALQVAPRPSAGLWALVVVFEGFLVGIVPDAAAQNPPACNQAGQYPSRVCDPAYVVSSHTDGSCPKFPGLDVCQMVACESEWMPNGGYEQIYPATCEQTTEIHDNCTMYATQVAFTCDLVVETTCAENPDPDPDDECLCKAITQAGGAKTFYACQCD
jgi:hypothetical protein